MRSTTLLATAFAVGAAVAQFPSSTQSSATSTTSRKPTVHTVTVGKANDQFDPMNLQAAVGDIVTFQFFPPNHSVIRSEYKYPCVPYEDLGPDRTGFFSGFFPVNTIENDMPTWNLTINDTQPIFYYCSAPGSCLKMGMVGGINANATAVSDQANRAKAAQFMLQPGEPFPAEESSAISSAAAATATVTASPSASPTSSPSPTPAPAHKSLGGGAIAGIAIGALAALALAGALFYFIGRSRSLKQSLNHQRHFSAPMSEAGSYAPSSHQGGPVPHYLSGSTTIPSHHTSSDNGRWSNQHPALGPHSVNGLPPYYTQEMKSPNLGNVDEVGSIRSNSPPAQSGVGTPYTMPLNSQLGPNGQQGEWYFAPAPVTGRNAVPRMHSAELSAGGQAVGGGGGVFHERGLGGDDRPAGAARRRVHELEAQRGSLMNGEKSDDEDGRV